MQSVAWDATVGAGELSIEMPTLDSIATLRIRLDRTLDQDDLKLFATIWKRCIQEAEQQ